MLLSENPKFQLTTYHRVSILVWEFDSKCNKNDKCVMFTCFLNNSELRLLWPPCRNFSGLTVAWNTVTYFSRYFKLRMPIFGLHLIEGWRMTWRLCKKEPWYSMLSKTCIKTLRPVNSDQNGCSIDKTSSGRKIVPVIWVIDRGGRYYHTRS